MEEYILRHIDEEDPVLRELSHETHLKTIQPRMVSGYLQGLVLSMFSKMIQPRNILEVGTFTGYSTICLARGLKKGGRLYTIEINDELEEFAQKYFRKAGVAPLVKPLFGPAIEVIPSLDITFDLVYLDANKKEYSSYYRLVFDKVANGGYILADNTLWNGKVTDSGTPDDAQTQGIIDFNNVVKNDPRVEKVILPIRDGITVIRKKQD